MTYQGYPFLQAADYAHGRQPGQPTVIIIHTMEVPQYSGAAADVASVFHHGPANPSSAHACVDDTILIRCVTDEDTAYQAGTHGNRVGLGIEHAGYASMTTSWWRTPFSTKMLARSAHQAATWCARWGIPLVKLNPAGLQAGHSGFAGHHDFTLAFPGDTTHTDPGLYFPWPAYLAQVAAILHPAPAPLPVPKPIPKPRGAAMPHIVRVGADRTANFELVGVKGDGTLVLWKVSEETALDVRAQQGTYSECTTEEFGRLSAGATIH